MKRSLLYIFSFLIGTAPLTAAYGQDVHFGTIFVEEKDYDQEESIESVNHLTDGTKSQKELEILFKKQVGLPNAKLKKINLDRTPASNASQNNKDKVGVVKNDELPQNIIYFLELRSFPGNDSVSIHQGSSATSNSLMQLEPGEMIKVVDSPSQYIHKLRMDRDSQGLWKSIYTREQDVKSPHIYYDWRNFETITSHEFPIELDLLVPYGQNTIPVFSKPGAWTAKDCNLNEELCIDFVDLHTKAYLFDASIIDVSLSKNLTQTHRLFYKIGYKIKDKDGQIQNHVGWIPSKHAKRKISQLPKSLIATRSPDSAFGTYESDQERRSRLKKYYVFKSNMDSNNLNMSRWINSTPGNSTEVFFQNIAIDGIAQFNNFTMDQSFLNGQRFTQQGVAVGFGIFAPIFIDLEIQGSAEYTIPVNANEDATFKKSPLFKAEQWLLYTTPISISGVPFKFGAGAYYFSMFASQRDFGFNSLLGFQFKGLFENESFWSGFRYGPTGQDLSFKLENREIGLDVGFRLNPARKYESWSIFADYSDTSFISNQKNKTTFQIFSFGIRKQF